MSIKKRVRSQYTIDLLIESDGSLLTFILFYSMLDVIKLYNKWYRVV